MPTQPYLFLSAFHNFHNIVVGINLAVALWRCGIYNAFTTGDNQSEQDSLSMFFTQQHVGG